MNINFYLPIEPELLIAYVLGMISWATIRAILWPTPNLYLDEVNKRYRVDE